MSTAPTEPAEPAARPVRPRWQRAAMAVSITFALMLGLLGAGGYLVYRHLDSNITVDPSANGELRTGPSATGSASTVSDAAMVPMNILVMGSDTRVGQGGEGGSAKVYSSAQSDVVMLVHLYQGHKRALVMSIPRDTWVHVPTCKNRSGHTVGGYDAKFNAAFAIAGPACTIKQVKQLTGLPIDHFVIVDFNGVKDIINALGGVQFCLKQAMHDPIQNGHGSGLNLPAGHQVVLGEQGLAFLRARYSVGDGSDISRLVRQHAFLGAMVKQLQDAAVLTNLPRLYSILDSTTKAITTDPGLGSLSKLKDLAQTLTGLKPADVTFLTIPWKPRGDGANVLVDTAQAQPVLDAIANDTPYPPVVTPPAPGTAPLKTAPADIHVKVLNASGVSGTGTRAAAALAALGFQITSVTTAPSTLASSVVHYSSAYDESGRTLTAAVTGAGSVVDKAIGGTLVLYVGADYSGVQKVSVPTALPATAQIRTAAQAGCV